MTIQQFLQQAKRALASVADKPLLEAEILLAYTLGKERSYLYTWPCKIPTDKEAKQFAAYLKRRCNHEPIAYICGIKEFWSLELTVTSETFIPRPETELLVETLLNLGQGKRLKVADLGTGSGAIALAIAHEQPDWQVYATDKSSNALIIAKNNAQKLKSDNIIFCQGHWLSALTCKEFDMIVCNPPYIAEDEWETYASSLKFEPRNALVSGKDGLDAIREICISAPSYLKPSGYVLIEHGFLQGQAVRQILSTLAYENIISLMDLSNCERVTIGRTSTKSATCKKSKQITDF